MAAAAGIFMAPLSQEFGWGKAMASSGLSIAAISGALLSPFFGILIDRFGTRKLALPGLVLSGLCVTAFGFATGNTVQWIIMWSLYSLACLAIKSTVWTTAVSGVFDKGRGLAIGVALSGSAISMTITPPLANYLINNFGWRHAFAWIGLGWGGLTLLLCLFFLFDAHDIRRRPKVEGQASLVDIADLPGLTIAQAWRCNALWRIGIATFVMMFITIALNVHQYSILTVSGVSRTTAANYAALAGFFGILGKLITGWLLDRYRVNWVGGITLGSTAIAFAALLMPHPSTAVIVAAMLMNGYAAGTKLQIAGLLTSRYGGIRNFGKIFGMMATLIAAGSGLGPWAAGKIFDSYGSYQPFLWIGVAGSLIGGLIIAGMSRQPEWDEPSA